MSEREQLVHRTYEAAKQGDWKQVTSAWRQDRNLARECGRYHRPSSGWTFLHQAAYFGHEPACRELIRAGATVDAASNDQKSAADIAAERNHRTLATMLRQASLGADSPWTTSEDPQVLPSSCRWREAVERRATEAMQVAYAGVVIAIPAGSPYYVDSFERILVGWHGTYNPPCGMDGEPMV